MDQHNLCAGRINYLLIVWVVTLIILGGCTPPADIVEPPQAPDEIAGVVLDASPNDLALTRSDMPAGFQLAAEKSSGPEYVALYLRPSALDAEASGGNFLLSILTSVAVYTTTADAETVYLEVTADPSKQAFEDIELPSGAATDLIAQPFEGAAQGADASEAYRVTYSLMGQRIFEYGHRLRLGNVLAYVVVAAIGDPDEPQHLHEDARALVQRQIDHISTAAMQGASE